MPSLSPLPIWHQIDGNGRPYAGGLLYTYAAGGTTPKATYSDESGTANTNPVVLDSNGRAAVWLGDGAYKMIFTDGQGASLFDPGTVEGNTVWSADNINLNNGVLTYIVDTYAGLAGLTGSAQAIAIVRGYNEAYDGGGGVYVYDTDTSTWKLFSNSNLDVRWFGAVGDGTTDDRAAFIAANTLAGSLGVTIYANKGTYFLSADPGLTVPIELKPGAVLKWGGYHLTVQPAIALSDVGQHFSFGTGDDPVFPADTEIRTSWLTGISVSIITDNGAPFTSGSVKATINGTAYTVGWATDKATTLGALATTIATNAAVNTAIYSSANNNITVTAKKGYAVSIVIDSSSAVGGVAFTVNSNGWTQHSLAVQSDIIPIQTGIINLNGAVSKTIYVTDFVTILTDNGGGWTAGTFSVTVNDVTYSRAYATSKDASLTALAAQIATDANVSAAVYNSSNHQITITPIAKKKLIVTVDFSGVTGGMTVGAFVGGGWTAGAAVITINGAQYSYSYLSNKASSMGALAALIAANTALISACTYDSANNWIKIVPVAGVALYVTVDLSAITGSMVFYVENDTDQKIDTLQTGLKVAQDNITTLQANGTAVDPETLNFGSFVMDFMSQFNFSPAKSPCTFKTETLIHTLITIADGVNGFHLGWTSGTAKIIVNGVTYSQAYDTNEVTSITKLLAQITAVPNLLYTAAYDSAMNTIRFVPKFGITLTVTSDLTGLTGGSTMTFTINTIQTTIVRIAAKKLYGLSLVSGAYITPWFTNGVLPFLIPSSIRPIAAVSKPITTIDNSGNVKQGMFSIGTDGSIKIYYDWSGTSWPGSGNSAGFEDTVIEYPISTMS